MGRGIAALAARQQGVVARWQLVTLGVSQTMIRDRMASGLLLPLHRGVYAVGHRQLRREGRWLAAVLALGPGAVLSHRDAAGLHGLRPANHSRIDVSTPRRGARDQPGIGIHRTATLDPTDVTHIMGIPVTTVVRTLVDLAGSVPRDHLARAMSEAERQRLLDIHALEVILKRTSRRHGPGHANVRAVLAEHRDRGVQLTRSVLEERFVALATAHGIARPRMNATIEGVEVDAAWPGARLAVELDGYAHHHDRRSFQRDRDKANLLTEAGWSVLRFTHDDVMRRPADTAAQVMRLLRRPEAA